MTVRLRLALLYGLVFLVAGAALVGISYQLVSRNIPADKLAVVSSQDVLARAAKLSTDRDVPASERAALAKLANAAAGGRARRGQERIAAAVGPHRRPAHDRSGGHGAIGCPPPTVGAVADCARHRRDRLCRARMVRRRAGVASARGESPTPRSACRHRISTNGSICRVRTTSSPDWRTRSTRCSIGSPSRSKASADSSQTHHTSCARR